VAAQWIVPWAELAIAVSSDVLAGKTTDATSE
jgi:hypothetical protein